jgi:hypothetical protein
MNNPYNFNGLLGGFDPLRGQSLMGQPARMPAPSDATLSLQQRMQPQQGLLSRAGSGFAGAASGLGSGFAGAARGLGRSFTGEGSSARLSALGASLLQGPSRTPISLGSSLAQGLLAGNIAAQHEEERKFKRGLLEREMAVAEGKLSAEERKLNAGSLEDLFIAKDRDGNIIGQFPQGSSEYNKAVADPSITLYKTPNMPEGSSVSGKIEGFQTVYIDGKPVTAEKFKDKYGNVSFRDMTTKSPISDFSIERPESKNSEIKTESPFTVRLTKPFGDNKVGDELTIQSVTIDGQEDLYMTDSEGKRKKIPTDAFTREFLSRADVLKVGVGQIEKLDSKISEQQSALAGLDKFGSLAEQAESMGVQGVSFAIKKIKTAFDTFAGRTLSEEQKVIEFLRANQQRTLGRIRTEILGPGVLTENDAKRLIKAMGTDIEGWFANPTLLKETISDIRAEKMDTLSGIKGRRDSWSRGEVPKPSNRLFMPSSWTQKGGTYAGWNQLSKQQKKDAIRLGKGSV